MNMLERMHFVHRAWRYRLRGEKFGVSFLLDRDLEGKTAVDIGAHRGIYSYWMHKKVGTQGAVIAFEPQPELASYLTQAKTAFHLQQLEIAKLGLSSAQGNQELVRPKDHWGGASVEITPRDDTEQLKIEMTTLDSYLADHSARPVKFIKCDVEGHEYDVFKGGQQVLREDRPDLLFECFDVEDPDCKVFQLLDELGYDGFCFHNGGLAPLSEYMSLRSSIHKKALLNFVFKPRETERQHHEH